MLHAIRVALDAHPDYVVFQVNIAIIFNIILQLFQTSFLGASDNERPVVPIFPL
jgi:hypothetical protein